MTAYSSPYYDPPVRFREVITRADIDALVDRGQTRLVLGERGTVTDEAREHALNLGIVIQHGDREARSASSPPPAPTAARATMPAPAPQAMPASAQTSGETPAARSSATGAPASSGNAATQAGIIEAVAAELHARGIAPTTALIQQVVTGVNRTLAASNRR